MSFGAGKVLFERVAEWVPKHPNRSGKARVASQPVKEAASGSGAGGGGRSGKKARKNKK
jgi:hypothetical protein